MVHSDSWSSLPLSESAAAISISVSATPKVVWFYVSTKLLCVSASILIVIVSKKALVYEKWSMDSVDLRCSILKWRIIMISLWLASLLGGR